jgi:hypothetical protein
MGEAKSRAGSRRSSGDGPHMTALKPSARQKARRRLEVFLGKLRFRRYRATARPLTQPREASVPLASSDERPRSVSRSDQRRTRPSDRANGVDTRRENDGYAASKTVSACKATAENGG